MKGSRITAVFFVVIFTNCASTPPPAWVTNVQSVYPREVYITGLGRSNSSRRDAEEKALAEIALYFVTQISVERSLRTAWTEQDGVFTSESRMEENSLVESHARLVAVRYAQDPWYNPATKEWETIAYIQRDEGWSAYEATARRQAEAFLNLVKAAEEEIEPFTAVLRLGIANAYAESVEFITVRDFSQVLHPALASAFFGSTDSAWASLRQKQLLARERAVISIQCPVDQDRIIYQAMVKALGNEGFATGSRGNTATVCVIQVEEGMQVSNSGTFYTPSLTTTISGSTGAMMSFQVNTERFGASNSDVAKRRAYNALAAALESTFSTELERWQSALIR